MKRLSKFGLLSAAVLALLTACGGGDSTPSTTLSGTAAVGAPIVGGTVNVMCAGGSALTATTTATGTWQVTTSGQTLPCAVRVNGGTVNGSANATPYHSIAISFGVVNITPLTDLIVANLAGSLPGAWFESVNASALQSVNSTQITAALNTVSTALGLTSTLNGASPFTTAFVATAGNLMDNILEALAAAGVSHSTLLSLATNASFTAPVGYNFASAYSIVVSTNGSGGGGGGGGGSGLTVEVAISGIASPSITVTGVPAPATQDEFCGALASDSTFTGIEASGGGTLTINSCSFANNVGTVAATLTITTPYSLTLPYTIKYTYN